MNNLPGVFIVGAAKAGTTSLYHIMKAHPQIYMSPVKEPNYFSDDTVVELLRPSLKKRLKAQQIEKFIEGEMKNTIHTAYIRDFEVYKKLFRNIGQKKIAGEASVSYLYSKTAAKNIFYLIPEAKIIIILRDPIQRAFSHYLMDLQLAFTTGTFASALSQDMEVQTKSWGVSSHYIETGLYAEQVKRYLDVFPASQVKIVLYDDLKKKLFDIIKELYAFAGVDDSFIPEISEKYNTAIIPRSEIASYALKFNRLRIAARKLLKGSLKRNIKKIFLKTDELPQITSDEKKLLRTYFKNDVSRLEKMIKRDLSSWLK